MLSSDDPITQALIRGRSLKAPCSRKSTGIQKNALKSDQSAFEKLPAILYTQLVSVRPTVT